MSVLCLLREGPATLSVDGGELGLDIGEGSERDDGSTNELDLVVMKSMSCKKVSRTCREKG